MTVGIKFEVLKRIDVEDLIVTINADIDKSKESSTHMEIFFFFAYNTDV